MMYIIFSRLPDPTRHATRERFVRHGCLEGATNTGLPSYYSKETDPVARYWCLPRRLGRARRQNKPSVRYMYVLLLGKLLCYISRFHSGGPNCN